MNNVLGVLFELFRTVRVDVSDCGKSGIPGYCPVPMSLDDFGWFSATERELETTERRSGLVICNSGGSS